MRATTAGRYTRLADAFAATIAGVADDRWSNPSPCEGWTARDVVGHVVETQGLFLGFIGLELGEIPPVVDDPGAAWEAARAVTSAALADEKTATTTYQGYTGPTTFERGVDQFLCFDLIVHGWDLARAAGLDDRIEPADLAALRDAVPGFGTGLNSPGVCGPALDPPAGADEQTTVLARLGRQARS